MHSVHLVEKDLESFKNMTGSNIWTERQEITTDYYPKKQSNFKLLIGALIPINIQNKESSKETSLLMAKI